MHKESNLFFDLDGTILDSRQRLFQLFNSLVPQSQLTIDQYWDMKRDQLGHAHILEKHFGYTADEILDFERKWMPEIEKESWLKLDTPFEWVAEFFEKLHSQYNLYIVTDRQSKQSAVNQVRQHQWSRFLKDILVTEKKVDKYKLICAIPTNRENSWFIGDTGMDIRTGQQLGVKTAAVLSGFRNRAALEKYNPDIIVDKAIDLVPNLL